ncbi:unnamed protein product [Vicia faba]|uniref:30S ribosomal protein S9 n=1 Tax=Vicia faba TaxID=3906 RepID=A0AAV1AA43_VICFA|nr:unnamed protein product [Vicia faba]
MLSRLIPKNPYNFRRFFPLPFKQPYFPNPHFAALPKPFSSSSSNNNNNNTKYPFSNSNVWKSFGETEEKVDNLFTEESESVDEVNDVEGERVRKDADADEEKWYLEEKGIDNEDENTLFKGINSEAEGKGSGSGEFGDHIYQPWNMKEDAGDVFGFKEEDVVGKDKVGELDVMVDGETKEDVEKLEKEEKELTVILEGPKRAFGDLIADSGITDEMLDSLIALKDFEGIDGLPPLRVIEDMRYENNTRKSTRAEMERLKQEEAAKARVRQVDDKGRAYGTGRRKCSIARVWVQPGNGKFMVNDKEFDVYFPMIDHRATLLRPFSETKTLGLWDVNCTVKGGGVSGQVGAIRLGVSKALQNWEPELRPALRSVGFLTRDSRVVERKKPGKAKARKSYQWVKR